VHPDLEKEILEPNSMTQDPKDLPYCTYVQLFLSLGEILETFKSKVFKKITWGNGQKILRYPNSVSGLDARVVDPHHFNANPDPDLSSKNNAGPSGSESSNLITCQVVTNAA
jgi:hypothetical protein